MVSSLARLIARTALAGGEPGGYLRPPAAGTRRSLLSLGGRALRVGDRGVDLAHSAGEVAGRLGFDVRLPADVGLIAQFRIVLGALVLPGSVKTKMFLQPARPASRSSARRCSRPVPSTTYCRPSTGWVTGIR